MGDVILEAEGLPVCYDPRGRISYGGMFENIKKGCQL